MGSSCPAAWPVLSELNFVRLAASGIGGVLTSTALVGGCMLGRDRLSRRSSAWACLADVRFMTLTRLFYTMTRTREVAALYCG